MNQLDDEIRRAMQAGENDLLLARAGDEGMIAQVAATFRGRMRMWVIVTWSATLFWVGVAVWAAIAFFRTQSTRDWIMYACIFLSAIVATAMLKLWYLMEINRNTHTREIKRVELQLARLSAHAK